MVRPHFSLYLLSLLMLGATFWSYWTQIDIAVRARGIVRPSREVVRIVSEVSGKIVRPPPSESSRVRRGDVLLALDPASLTVRLRSIRSQIHYSELRLADLDARLRTLAALNAAAADVDASEHSAAIDAARASLSE